MNKNVAGNRRDSVRKHYLNSSSFGSRLEYLDHLLASREFQRVLDVGCYGQGFSPDNKDWPHNFIRDRVPECVGIDLAPEVEELRDSGLDVYKMSAEDLNFVDKFDLIYAGDLLEHLSNPGQFIEGCRRCLNKDGYLVITTPNPYYMVWLIQKFIIRQEPSTNPEHTCLFNVATLIELFERYDFEIKKLDFIKTLGLSDSQGYGMTSALYVNQVFGYFTNKYYETFAVMFKMCEG